MRSRFEERLTIRLFPIAKLLLLVICLIVMIILISIAKENSKAFVNSILLFLTFWFTLFILIIAIIKQKNMANKEELEIQAEETPIAKVIREQFEAMSKDKQDELLGDLTIQEFLEERTEIFLEEYIQASQSGNYTPSGAREIAIKAATEGIELH